MNWDKLDIPEEGLNAIYKDRIPGNKNLREYKKSLESEIKYIEKKITSK